MGKVLRSLSVYLITLCALTMFPRNIWYYKKCNEIQNEAQNLCDSKWTLFNRSITIPESTEHVKGFTYQEKYAILDISRRDMRFDSLILEKLFSQFKGRQEIEIGGSTYFRIDTTVFPFVRGIELVRTDLRRQWIISYGRGLYTEKHIFGIVEKNEAKNVWGQNE